MNSLDRLIAFISPAAGLRRAAARSAIKNLYEAARPSRGFDGWWTTDAAADAEIGSQMAKLRARARDLGRNNPFICRAHDMLAAKMVGTGIRPRLADEVAPQIRLRTMDLWKRWCDEADTEGLRDLYSLQLLAARTVVESGEALIRFVPTPGLRIPWTIRVLEPDWIDSSQHRPLTNGGAIVLGVEYNSSGRRVAYHMWTRHPGSDLNSRPLSQTDIERVSAEYIAPIFYGMRPEQTRGVPWCVPSVAYAKNLDDLWYARQERAKAQACFTAFVRKVPDSNLGIEPETGRRLKQLSPGMIEYLKPDEDITFGTPPAGSGDDEWQIMLLHAIAAGCGLTYSQLTGDLRQVNYSSMRAGSLDFWSLLDTWQQLMLKPMLCRPLWKKFDQFAAVGQRRTDLLEAEWDFPERPFVDPVKDGQAIDAALLAGRRTFHEVISSSGRDPETLIAELFREREELAGLNLQHLAPQGAGKLVPSSAPQTDPAAAGADGGDGTDAPPPNGGGNGAAAYSADN